MSDRVSKELSANAKSKGDSRECFIEVYIDNWSLFVIVFFKSFCVGLAMRYSEEFFYLFYVDDVSVSDMVWCKIASVNDTNDKKNLIFEKKMNKNRIL
jgi:hypothetical protein